MGDGQHRNLPTSVAHGWPRSPEQRARHRDKYRDTDPPAAQSRPPAHGAVRQHSCKLCRSATQRLSRGVSYVIFPTRGDRPSLLSLTSHPSCRAISAGSSRPTAPGCRSSGYMTCAACISRSCRACRDRLMGDCRAPGGHSCRDGRPGPRRCRTRSGRHRAGPGRAGEPRRRRCEGSAAHRSEAVARALGPCGGEIRHLVPPAAALLRWFRTPTGGGGSRDAHVCCALELT